MNLPSLRVGRFGAQLAKKSGDTPSGSLLGPYAGLLKPPETPRPPERLFGVPHRLLYNTTHWGHGAYTQNVYNMVLKWLPEFKAYKLVDQSDAVEMSAMDEAVAAGVTLYAFVGGPGSGRYLTADRAELSGGGSQGSASALSAYNHTAAMAQKAADEAAAVVAAAEAEADQIAAAEAQVEADVLQEEAARLVETEATTGRTRLILGALLVPAAFIIRALMWSKSKK